MVVFSWGVVLTTRAAEAFLAETEEIFFRRGAK
jgi:hypothetical protein